MFTVKATHISTRYKHHCIHAYESKFIQTLFFCCINSHQNSFLGHAALTAWATVIKAESSTFVSVIETGPQKCVRVHVCERVRLKLMLMAVSGHFRTSLTFTEGKEEWWKNGDSGRVGRMTSVSVHSVYTCSLPPELRQDVKPFCSVLMEVFHRLCMCVYSFSRHHLVHGGCKFVLRVPLYTFALSAIPSTPPYP